MRNKRWVLASLLVVLFFTKSTLFAADNQNEVDWTFNLAPFYLLGS